MIFVIKNAKFQNSKNSHKFLIMIKLDKMAKIYIYEFFICCFAALKEPQTISIYSFYLLRNHVDTSTKSK